VPFSIPCYLFQGKFLHVGVVDADAGQREDQHPRFRRNPRRDPDVPSSTQGSSPFQSLASLLLSLQFFFVTDVSYKRARVSVPGQLFST
jgi:hypothetical protein